MASTAQEAYDAIIAYIRRQGGQYSDWYCGITDDTERRLFDEHRVPGESSWIHVDCESNEAARATEEALINLGCDGGAGGGDENSIHVYAYLKTSITNP